MFLLACSTRLLSALGRSEDGEGGGNDEVQGVAWPPLTGPGCSFRRPGTTSLPPSLPHHHQDLLSIYRRSSRSGNGLVKHILSRAVLLAHSICSARWTLSAARLGLENEKVMALLMATNHDCVSTDSQEIYSGGYARPGGVAEVPTTSIS